MIPNDPHFNKILEESFTRLPFRQLAGRIDLEHASDAEALYQAFLGVFHASDAGSVKNVLFIWAVDRPFIHENGNKLPSTISYIEISKGTVKGRWPKRFFRNLTRDYNNKGEALATAGLQELADRDKNLLYYSRLIRDHGPMRIWYATLDDLRNASHEHCREYQTVRDWERHLLKSYRGVHGSRCRPPKNRRD